MSNYEIEKMLNKGVTKEELLKQFEEKIVKAQETIEEKKKAAAVRKEKEATAEKMRREAVAALKKYFSAIGYKDAFVDVHKNGVTVKLGNDRIEGFNSGDFWDLINRCF